MCRCAIVVLDKRRQASIKKKAMSELEKSLIGMIGAYMTDANQEVRNQAKVGIQ